MFFRNGDSSCAAITKKVIYREQKHTNMMRKSNNHNQMQIKKQQRIVRIRDVELRKVKYKVAARVGV